MYKIFKNIAPILFAGILLISSAGCTASTTAKKSAVVATRQVAVQSGNISTTVSVDGNLVMPETSSLAFGAAGNVKDVLVQEGDRVKAGAIMATLEDTTQMLDIKSANISVQNVLSNLYEKVPRLPQFPGTYYDRNTTTTITPGYWVSDWHDDGAHNWVWGPRWVAPVTKTTSTFIEKPRWDWKWDDVTKQWINDPNIPENTGLSNSYTVYYPNATSLNSFNWAASEISNSYYYLLSENYTAASSELNIAVADLEATAKIIEDTIENPESGLGNTAPAINDENELSFLIQQEGSFAGYYVQVLRSLVKDIRQGAADIAVTRDLITQKKYVEAAPLYDTMLTKMSELGTSIITNYNVIKVRNDTKIYGQDICLYLYSAADKKLNAALKGIETGGLNSQELDDNLRIAKHYMELCNGILGTNDYVLQHGLSLKAEQQYKIDLAKSLVDLGNKRDDFLKTVIMAPFDGIVVSVGVKNNDVLSAMDYSSKTIQIVDTSQVKFTGTVDEIDIMKIKTGQKATVSIDAISGKTFPGHVSFISPFGVTSGSVVKFNITVLLNPTDVDLKGGLTASADVAISTVANALMLPISAVTTTTEGSFVTVMNSTTNLQEKKKVTTGVQNTQYIQIVSGLNEGDKVIVEDKATGAPVSTTMGPPGGSGGGPPPGR
jgi:multidrug efflux pump subunit AcrA (membrane-fusion protein)